MAANPDFKDLFKLLRDEAVEYLVVGAHAVVYYAEPRFTKDMDIWVNPTPENAVRVFRALKRFGAPLSGATERDFTDKELIYQVGVAPNRIDMLMDIAGVSFAEAWKTRETSSYDGVEIYILSKTDLIESKKASGRPQDLLDVEKLEED